MVKHIKSTPITELDGVSLSVLLRWEWSLRPGPIR